jgi:hypothetical protein
MKIERDIDEVRRPPFCMAHPLKLKVFLETIRNYFTKKSVAIF